MACWPILCLDIFFTHVGTFLSLLLQNTKRNKATVYFWLVYIVIFEFHICACSQVYVPFSVFYAPLHGHVFELILCLFHKHKHQFFQYPIPIYRPMRPHEPLIQCVKGDLSVLRADRLLDTVPNYRSHLSRDLTYLVCVRRT